MRVSLRKSRVSGDGNDLNTSADDQYFVSFSDDGTFSKFEADEDAIDSANEVDESLIMESATTTPERIVENKKIEDEKNLLSRQDFRFEKDVKENDEKIGESATQNNFSGVLTTTKECSSLNKLSFLMQLKNFIDTTMKVFLLKFNLFFLFFFMLVFFILPGFFSGIIFGIYISTMAIIVGLIIIGRRIFPERSELSINLSSTAKLQGELEILSQNEVGNNWEEKKEIYKGWMNILDEDYTPEDFDINQTQTVLVRLDGKFLRISRPNRTLLKHAFHTDPTLTETPPRMITQSIFDLTNANVRLRPRRLARRRWFSRKYPICLILPHLSNKKAQISETKSQGMTDSFLASCSLNSFSKDASNVTENFFEEVFDVDSSQDDEAFAPLAHFQPQKSNFASYSGEQMRHSISNFEIASSSPPLPSVFQSFTKVSLNRKKKQQKRMYLFARSAREKERWFHCLRKACFLYKTHATGSSSNDGPQLSEHETRRRYSSSPNVNEPRAFDYNKTLKNMPAREYLIYLLHQVCYKRQIKELLESRKSFLNDEKGRKKDAEVIPMDLGRNYCNETESSVDDQFITLINLVVSRVFYDFCRDDYWCGIVRNRFQTKLSTITLPYFVETPKLSQLDIGSDPPTILRIFSPRVDDWGLWIDFEIKYTGRIRLVLETKVNVMRFIKQVESSNHNNIAQEASLLSTIFLRRTPTAYSDSEVMAPESPERSPDEQFGSKLKQKDKQQSHRQGRAKKRIARFVDKVAHSLIVEKASALVKQNESVRKRVEEFSDTRLVLNVDVSAIQGVMTCNFAPPPSDRLWYCFRSPPQVSIKAVPQVGERSMDISSFGDWIEGKISQTIEAKILQAIEKNLVFPNMDDMIVPMMSGNELLSKGLFNT